MDRTGADFFRSANSIKEKLGGNACPIQIPIGAEDKFVGVVDLVKMQGIIWDGDHNGATFNYVDIPAELKETAEKYRTEMIEKLADFDESIMER